MSNFITNESFRCLLGKQSKEIEIINNLFLWKVGNKRHFAVMGELNDINIEKLACYFPCNFHYLTSNNIDILKNSFKIKKSRGNSVIIDIDDLSFSGNEGKNVRHCLNRCAKNKFSIEDNLRSIKDVENLIDEWSNNYTTRYFRDNSGKNTYFYKNNFHQGLISTFIYQGDNLVSFGTLTLPNIDGYSSYVLGKALYQRHYGLSEFADVELYKKAKLFGIKYVNLGQANKGLLFYKTKFNSFIQTHYDGQILEFK